ncbi:hypothetical protein D9M73_92340 [compost metagenome]
MVFVQQPRGHESGGIGQTVGQRRGAGRLLLAVATVGRQPALYVFHPTLFVVVQGLVRRQGGAQPQHAQVQSVQAPRLVDRDPRRDDRAPIPAVRMEPRAGKGLIQQADPGPGDLAGVHRAGRR